MVSNVFLLRATTEAVQGDGPSLDGVLLTYLSSSSIFLLDRAQSKASLLINSSVTSQLEALSFRCTFASLSLSFSLCLIGLALASLEVWVLVCHPLWQGLTAPDRLLRPHRCFVRVGNSRTG